MWFVAIGGVLLVCKLAGWGPQFLPKRIGRWHYSDAVQALTGQVAGDA